MSSQLMTRVKVINGIHIFVCLLRLYFNSVLSIVANCIECSVKCTYKKIYSFFFLPFSLSASLFGVITTIVFYCYPNLNRTVWCYEQIKRKNENNCFVLIRDFDILFFLKVVLQAIIKMAKKNQSIQRCYSLKFCELPNMAIYSQIHKLPPLHNLFQF